MPKVGVKTSLFQLLTDSDLALFSQGAVRHNLSVVKIKFWSDNDDLTRICETQSPKKLQQFLSQNPHNGRISIPGWAVFLLNCCSLTQLQYFDKSQPRVGFI